MYNYYVHMEQRDLCFLDTPFCIQGCVKNETKCGILNSVTN